MPYPYSRTNYTWYTDCAGDGLCTFAVKCFACTTPAYVLEEGRCITRSRCRKYSLYNSTTSGFNSAYCYCKTGFYLSGVTSCSICHYSCKTCNGSTASNCTECHTGAKLSGGLCVANSTYSYISKWNGAMPTNTATEIWTPHRSNFVGAPYSSTDTVCDSGSYVFGYYGYTSHPNTTRIDTNNFGTASLSFLSLNSSVALPHYGIHFRAKFLFIDDWVDGMVVLFQENGV